LRNKSLPEKNKHHIFIASIQTLWIPYLPELQRIAGRPTSIQVQHGLMVFLLPLGHGFVMERMNGMCGDLAKNC